MGSVTIRQFISPEWQNMFLRIGDEWWLDFVRTVNAANLMLKEQTPLGTDGSIVELCSGLKSTISQLSDGDVLIQ